MTNTITYDGRTFTLDEDYEHRLWGRVRFVRFYNDDCGYFRYEEGDRCIFRYDSFPLPETVTVTNTIQAAGRTFTLDEDYEHPEFGRLRFVGLYTDSYGQFRDKRGYTLSLRYDSFPPPEPEPEPETVVVRIPTFNSPYPHQHRFTREQALAAIKALQDALPGDDVWVRLSREDARGVYLNAYKLPGGLEWRVLEALTEALER